MMKRPNLFVVAFIVAVSVVVLLAQGNPVTIRTSTGIEAGTSAAPIRIDPTGGTAQPVTGTFWQATQPVSGTFWQATQPISAASLPLPTGAAADSSLTTLDTDLKSNVTLHAGTNVIGKVGIDQTTPGTTNGVVLQAETTKVIGTARMLGNAGAIVDGPTGAAPPANALYAGGLKSGATGGLLGGATLCDQDAVVNISTATTTLLITGVSGRQVRICSFQLVAGAADNVALIEGTGATCGTGTAGMAGGTTAASGYNFAANSGLAMGTGVGEVLSTVTTGDSVCAVTSAAAQLSGHFKYAIF